MNGITCTLWAFLGISTLVSFCLWNDVINGSMNKYFFAPKYLYKKTTMNKFGCYLCSFLICIFIPVYFIVMFCYWLLHVGREED